MTGMASQAITRCTREQYLAIERAAPFRSEYVAGDIVAMSGASRAHNMITLNVGAALNAQLQTGPCEAYVADMRVNVGAAFFYPDVIVACEEIHLLDDHQDTLLNPTVIFEVLSPSTEAYDRGEKFARYSEIPSLQDFVFVSQERFRIEHLARVDGGKWLLSVYTEPDSVLDLSSVGCRITLADAYRKVKIETTHSAADIP
jgi:Uma2 family endonuclease